MEKTIRSKEHVAVEKPETPPKSSMTKTWVTRSTRKTIILDKVKPKNADDSVSDLFLGSISHVDGKVKFSDFEGKFVIPDILLKPTTKQPKKDRDTSEIEQPGPAYEMFDKPPSLRQRPSISKGYLDRSQLSPKRDPLQLSTKKQSPQLSIKRKVTQPPVSKSEHRRSQRSRGDRKHDKERSRGDNRIRRDPESRGRNDRSRSNERSKTKPKPNSNHFDQQKAARKRQRKFIRDLLTVDEYNDPACCPRTGIMFAVWAILSAALILVLKFALRISFVWSTIVDFDNSTNFARIYLIPMYNAT